MDDDFEIDGPHVHAVEHAVEQRDPLAQRIALIQCAANAVVHGGVESADGKAVL